MKLDDFISPRLKLENIDNYHIRLSIFNALKENLKYFNGKFLDVGCGKMPYRDFILNHSQINKYTGLDIETAIDYGGNKPDVYWDGINMPFDKNEFDCAMATEVFEHCPDPLLTMREIYRALKPGGVLFFTVPFLWPLHEVPHDEFRYTPFSLQRLLTESGFDNIQLKSSGGWDASLAQMIGLWVRRRGLPRALKFFLSIISLPIIKFLIKADKKPNDIYKSVSVLTGITGIAFKL